MRQFFTLDKPKNLKFRLDENNPSKSDQTTDVVKYLCSHTDDFMNFKNPEILVSAFGHHELFTKETFVATRDQQRFFHPFISV